MGQQVGVKVRPEVKMQLQQGRATPAGGVEEDQGSLDQGEAEEVEGTHGIDD